MSPPEETLQVMKEDWTVPRKPLLYKTPRRDKPNKRVPLMVYGWAIGFEEQMHFANMFDVGDDTTVANQAHVGLRYMMRYLPPRVKGPILIHFKEGPGSCRLCIYIGSNKCKEHIPTAEDKEFVLQVWNALGLDAEPRWFRPMD